jgi:hypothetical protein
MSAGDQLPELVRAFILKNIDSVAELEALLLARASASEWDVASLANRLYVTEAEARVVLESLHSRGLLSLEGDRFKYAPASDSLRGEVEALAAAYPQFLIPITNIVHRKPRASLRAFADAFRLREER